jgi:hypothetical protein
MIATAQLRTNAARGAIKVRLNSMARLHLSGPDHN